MQTMTKWWVGAVVGLAGLSCTQLNVVPVAVGEITVVPAQLEAEVAQQAVLEVVLRATTGELLTDRAVDWSSTDPTVATVDSVGAVTAVSPGQTIIAATVEGLLGTALITVGEPPPSALHLQGPRTSTPTTTEPRSSTSNGATTPTTRSDSRSNGESRTGPGP